MMAANFRVSSPIVKAWRLWIPGHVGAADRRGPFELEIAEEAGFDLERMFGFDVEEDDCAGFVHRDEQRFADREGVAGVGDGGGFRADADGARERFGGD